MLASLLQCQPKSLRQLCSAAALWMADFDMCKQLLAHSSPPPRPRPTSCTLLNFFGRCGYRDNTLTYLLKSLQQPWHWPVGPCGAKQKCKPDCLFRHLLPTHPGTARANTRNSCSFYVLSSKISDATIKGKRETRY